MTLKIGIFLIAIAFISFNLELREVNPLSPSTSFFQRFLEFPDIDDEDCPDDWFHYFHALKNIYICSSPGPVNPYEYETMFPIKTWQFRTFNTIEYAVIFNNMSAESIKELNEQIELIKQQFEEANQARMELKEEVEKIKKQLTAKDLTISKLERELNEVKEQLADKDGDDDYESTSRDLRCHVKDPNAPRHPMSAFFIWMQENRKTFKKPGMSVSDVAKAAGVEWGKLKDKSKLITKTTFNNISLKDLENRIKLLEIENSELRKQLATKESDKSDQESVDGFEIVKPTRRRRRSFNCTNKGLALPKRTKSAFYMWMRDNQSILKKPGMSVGDIARAAGREWCKLEDKSEWEERARKDKERYERELKEYRSGYSDNKVWLEKISENPDFVAKFPVFYQRYLEREQTEPEPESDVMDDSD
ncbi:HMG box [Aphelenchoides bicaudatus]|nr:HMG box [Aphelenchoides bicaudatus]